MASKSKTDGYSIRLLSEVERYDLPELPAPLREDLKTIYGPALQRSPYKLPRKIHSHKLSGTLRGCRAINIELGASYRLVYRIQDKPAPRTVWIYSFAEHDLAYERAQLRRKRR